ncbi:MAG: FemAB family PEP-CTERM system-associated protein [Methylococcaceae bacterium]|nr:FemAB family PEP-CTERM system-associated protein [Methylococcaceae bacterium]
MRIRRLEPGDERRWDEYVAATPAATFFHRAGWRRVIEQGAGLPVHYLYAEEGGAITGGLPLAHVHSRLFGNALVSTPFCVEGGAVAADPATRQALEAAAVELGRGLGVDWVEFRNSVDSASGRPQKPLYALFRKAIAGDEAALLAAIPRKQRAVIRKAETMGLDCRPSTDPDRFYELYAESVRNLGTPVFPRAMFRLLPEVFGTDCRMLEVSRAGRPLAAVMSFYFRDAVMPYYAGATPESRRFHAQDLLYWRLMREAAAEGYRCFDFGRSKVGTGAYAYKRHWGFEPEPMHYEYALIGAPRVPDLNPLNPKYRLFIALWKRLPLSLSKLLGPRLARYLG